MQRWVARVGGAACIAPFVGGAQRLKTTSSDKRQLAEDVDAIFATLFPRSGSNRSAKSVAPKVVVPPTEALETVEAPRTKAKARKVKVADEKDSDDVVSIFAKHIQSPPTAAKAEKTNDPVAAADWDADEEPPMQKTTVITKALSKSEAKTARKKRQGRPRKPLAKPPTEGVETKPDDTAGTLADVLGLVDTASTDIVRDSTTADVAVPRRTTSAVVPRRTSPTVAEDQPARVLVLVPGFLVLELQNPPPAGYTTPFGRVVVASLDTCSAASARRLHAGDPAVCDLIVNPIHKHFGQSPHLMAINVRVD
eukprot:CAMPEP_0174837220 /NCGR_PEP_ID=MMETSP1114-20130205/6593_1 /TAXON_ID=312471 /ORGANISM="Neobodo designis, Strain CCAP 1951/1" /LENGTH=308 /DNA_ID=CAMNT_0016071269 /DNA_START=29 /DNA_END=955 /DNA_ORIENTATION=-